MNRDWNLTDLKDPCVLINHTKNVYITSKEYNLAKNELTNADRMSKIVYASIRQKIKRNTRKKMTQDDLTSETLIHEDWANWITTLKGIEERYTIAKIEYEKEDLKWKAIQSAMSFMKSEMQITKIN